MSCVNRSEASLRQRREYMRRWRRDMKRHFCECGRPASVNRSGDFMCSRCADMMSSFYAQEAAGIEEQRRMADFNGRVERFHAERFEWAKPLGCVGDSLRLLEARLAMVGCGIRDTGYGIRDAGLGIREA